MIKLSLSLFLAAFSFFAIGQTFTPVDAGSKVKFVIKNFGINTGGTFEGLSGSINYDPANPGASSFNVSVDAATVDTDIESRDRDLKKETYFDVKNHPKLTFQSTKVTKTNSPNHLYMFGKLTIKGVTKEIKFPFTATSKDGGYLFEGSFELNRRDFNVGGKSFSLADELDVTLAVFAK